MDVIDNGGGSVTVSWAVPTGLAPASYNVYLDGVLNQNVPGLSATITGLTVASYNGVTETLPTTHDIRVAPVVAGIEVGPALDVKVTPQQQQVMLTTPMSRGRFPFPNTPGGY